MTRDETIRFILNFYFENKRPVHLTLTSNTWLNGVIIDLKENSLILREEKFGEMPILFNMIKDDGIMPREERR